MNTIQDIYDEFTNKYDEFNTLLSESTLLYENNVQYEGHIYSKNIHAAIVEHCFMGLFLAWENFIEKTFLSYLCGETDLKGQVYSRYSTPNDIEHAYNMVKGTKQYPDWTNLDHINILSNIYFNDSGPFILLKSSPVELQHIKTIRNKISHVSEKSTRAFNSLLASTIFTTNISICDFLVTFKQDSDTYYSYYTNILKSYVEAICNK